MLADLALVLVVLGWLLPLGGALFAAACVPLVLLAVRQRIRVVFVGFVAASALGFLVGGTAVVTNLAITAAISTMVGFAMRRRWGPSRAAGAAVLVLWPPIAAISVGLLALFARLRKLALDQVHNSWTALRRLEVHLGLIRVARFGDRAVRYLTTHWWLLVPAVELVFVFVGSFAAYAIARRVIGRLADAVPRVPLGDGRPDGAAGPVPVELDAVGFRYPGATADALAPLTARIEAHRFVAVTGPNGAGKSTLARLLAGAAPTRGALHRPGSVALGRAGGTAFVFQRPESQVLGVRVRDDVVWGLPQGTETDVEGVLRSVGLAGLGDRDTATLSGGQLQRLAVAAALARRPALLVSDESTAMLDPAGRDRLLRLLRSLPGTEGPTVVHATHRRDEIVVADAVIALTPAAAGATAASAAEERREAWQRAAAHAEPRWAAADGSAESFAATRAPVAELRGVGYVYSAGTPWAHRALRGIDLEVGPRDAILVVGGNGSGKTTLAWILAGLLTPTEGEALLEGEPVVEQVGRVGLGFQHARLQLLRHTVGHELESVARGSIGVGAALELVGLPAAFAGRAIDDLSGGQQRRVALARLLAGDAPVLVLDEPMAGLDDDARAELVAVLVRLRAARAIGLVIVSHDLVELAPAVDRVVALRDGEIVLSQPADALGAVSAFLDAEEA